jgi:hypothetical protein
MGARGCADDPAAHGVDSRPACDSAVDIGTYENILLAERVTLAKVFGKVAGSNVTGT